jgi:uncharacterized protein (TIGR02145 family)
MHDINNITARYAINHLTMDFLLTLSRNLTKMKTISGISGIILAVLFISSCSEEKQVQPPMVTTTQVSGVLYFSAVGGGIVTDDGGGQVYARGVCWSTEANPTVEDKITIDGSGTGQFTSFLDGLSSGVTYHVRAYAANSNSIEYGEDFKFSTRLTGVTFNSELTYGTLADIEGKNYKTIPVGTQEWMAENLKATRFNDGTVIPMVTGNGQWTAQVTPAYSWCNDNDSVYENIYGAYYNWFAVSTGKLCPSGWHVPSDGEWKVLIDYLGGDKIAGSKLKEAGKNNWITPNRDANNQSGFTALPAGLREAIDGTFGGQGYIGGWWSSTESTTSIYGTAYARSIYGDTTVAARNEIYKKDGFSVRCIKD